MIVRALVRLDALADDMAARDLSQYKVIELVGEGKDWESAKAAIVVPEGAQLLAWLQGQPDG